MTAEPVACVQQAGGRDVVNRSAISWPTVRNLDGVFFRVERDGRWLSLCLTDLTEAERERTCNVVTTERKVSQMQTIVSKSCSCCGHVFGSEEHRPLLPGLDEEIVLGEVRIPNYCDECGAKVVDE